MTRELPAEIAPGESVRFAFSFRAPTAGVRRHEIPIFSGARKKPIAVLRPAVRARTTPPRIVHIPTQQTITVIRGQSSKVEIPVRSVELRNAPNLIRGVTIQADGLLTARVVKVNERRGVDPNTVTRYYQLVVSSSGNVLGSSSRHEGFALLETNGNSDVGKTDIKLRIQVLDPIAVIPSHLHLTASDQTPRPRAKVLLVRRGDSADPVRVGKYDSACLIVRKLKTEVQGRLVYEIEAKPNAQKHARTTVTFCSGDDGSHCVELSVVLANRRGD